MARVPRQEAGREGWRQSRRAGVGEGTWKGGGGGGAKRGKEEQGGETRRRRRDEGGCRREESGEWRVESGEWREERGERREERGEVRKAICVGNPCKQGRTSIKAVRALALSVRMRIFLIG